MNNKEIQDILDELHTVRPEMLDEKGKMLFEAIMKIADERDLYFSIIKEVREYIEMHTPSDIGICGNKTKRYYTLGEDSVEHILEILEKDNKE